MTGEDPGAAAAVAAVLGTGAAELIRRIGEDFGLAVSAAEPVGGGIDSAAAVWRVEVPATDGTRAGSYAAKLSARPRMRAGLALTAHLAAAGVPGIPAPVPALSGEVWTMRDGQLLSLTPWIAGRPGGYGGLDEDQWRTFGTMMAGLHATPVLAGIADLPREGYSTAWVDRYGAMDRRLRSLRAAGGTDSVITEALETWTAGSGRLRAAGERAQGLAARLIAANPPLVVCHADPHLFNMLVGPDRRITLIDWDDVVLAPRERDLMFVLGGVLAEQPVTDTEQAWFFSAYGEVAVDPDRLQYYYATRALEDAVGLVERAVVEREPEPGARAWAVRMLRALFSPAGMVALAGF